MAFLLLMRCTAQNDTLIEQDVVADLGRLTYYYTHAVVYEEPPSDSGPRMYLDTRDETGGM
jgi:hypothetical protein